MSLCSQTQADRYRDAHRELFRHFLRTLKGGTALPLLLVKPSLGSCSDSSCNWVFVSEVPQINEWV